MPDDGQDFELWPEHETAFRVFTQLATQWRVVAGMAGAWWQGLDYTVIPVVMDLYPVPPPDRPQVFADLRILEAAALDVLNAK